jgi:uncharacterized protein (DUF4415 family)
VLDLQQNGSVNNMKKNDEFPFAHARRITPSEVIAAEQAIQEQFGINYTRRGRPVKSETEKYQSVSIRLHPQVITWAKSEAEKQGVGYQTIINEALLKLVS